jgi:ParB family transcriptional regulator, chromosome partitioning protein
VEHVPRNTAPAHATGTVEFVPFAAIVDDVTFRLREEGDVSALAASIGRLGQLAPVELRALPDAAPEAPRYQVVAGFRRLAALRMLFRERVLARIHEHLEDDDAWALTLGEALLTAPLAPAELEAVRVRLAETGVAPWADELAEDALFRETPPEGEAEAEPQSETESEAEARLAEEEPEEQEQTVEMTPEELGDELAARLYEVNQDLALAFESWKDLPPQSRRLVLEQARYVVELFPHLLREDR